MKTDVKTEAEITAVLNRWTECYAKRDIAGLLALIAPDVVGYGTGADEKTVGVAEFRARTERDWSQSEAASFSYEWTSISAAGSVAWVTADMSINGKAGGQVFTYPGRFTAVFEKCGDRWLMVQAHFSLPAAGQAEGESFSK